MEEITNDPEANENEALTGEQASKEETAKKTPKEVAKVDIDTLDIDGLITTLSEYTKEEQWRSHRDEIEKILTRFRALFTVDFNERKKQFLEEGGNEIDFEYRPEFKSHFESLLRDYRKKKQLFYQKRTAEQKVNQERKESIIEEIKTLIGKDDNINIIYKTFKSLQESWYNTGPAPVAVNNTLWQNFKHHVERFYDFLHLNRELRELDFQHNYEEKLKIIEKAEALTTHTDILRATRDLNTLHRMWKNDLGPVAKEHREDLWKRFQEATKKIHDRRQDYQKNFESIQNDNLSKKEEILQQIESLINPTPSDHRKWQATIKNFEALKEQFQNIGYVPKKQSKQIWSKYRDISRAVNHAKNEFYKSQKIQQRENISKANKLVTAIKEILERDDWNTQVQQVKVLQKEWSKVGHLPKKMLPLRKEFQKLCNTFFDRLRGGFQRLSAAEEKVVKQRNTFLTTFKKQTPDANPEAITTFFKEQWNAWIALGTINSAAAKQTDEAFYDQSCIILNKLKLDSAQTLELQMEHLVRCMEAHPEAIRQAQAERKKEYDKIQTEAQQLENNLEFFSNSSSDSPMVKEVTKKLEKLQVHLDKINAERNQLQSLLRKQNTAAKQASDEATSADENTASTEASEEQKED